MGVVRVVGVVGVVGFVVRQCQPMTAKVNSFGCQIDCQLLLLVFCEVGMQFQSYPVPFVLNSFKRHYSKVKKVFLMLEEDGSFSFSYKYDREGGVRAENKIPNEEKATLFVVLMRRFLNPMDAISCRTVWTIVKKEFADILPAENIADIERFIEELNKGVGVINCQVPG